MPAQNNLARRFPVGGGDFWRDYGVQLGLFEPGYALDALVLDDSTLPTTWPCTLEQRLERAVYLSDGDPVAKYVAGRRLF